ncbi:MAG: CatB-related O-acetyltransferase [Ignavibacteriae bacterium]|nr:CatB-related O-acetyltransferase [Ignavibacteriota bacterium]
MIKRIRTFLWRILGVHYGQTLRVHDYVFLDKDDFTLIGRKTYHNGALVWRWTNAKLTIGNYCSIANNVRFIVDEGFHKSSQLTSFPLVNNLYKHDQKLPDGSDKDEFLNNVRQKAGIAIGHDVWIGMGAYIMPGVKIGNGVTVAANSVVTKDIDDYAVVAGAPAKIINYKHEKKVADKLNSIAWWNWEEKIIKERVLDFYLNPDDFVKKYEKK